MFFPTRRQLRELIFDEDGVAATEYAAILALVIIVCISAVRIFGLKLFESFLLNGLRIQAAETGGS
jgi:Flp pilus assembly pilin Flp